MRGKEEGNGEKMGKKKRGKKEEKQEKKLGKTGKTQRKSGKNGNKALGSGRAGNFHLGGFFRNSEDGGEGGKVWKRRKKPGILLPGRGIRAPRPS